jgi:hypothetical protein
VQAAVEPTVARAGELRLSESPDFQLRICYLRHRRNAVSLAPMMNRFQSRTSDWRGFNVGVFAFERARAA